MNTDHQNVVVCNLLDLQELLGVAQAALDQSIALLSLESPVPEGEFVLELHTPGCRPVLLVAQTAGDVTDGIGPLRLRPFDDEHYGQLLAFVCGTASAPVTRWSQDVPRAASIPRLDTIPDAPPDFREPSGSRSLGGPDPLLGRKLGGGKYLVEGMLGEGSAGAVYRCRHVALDKQLAIKVLHPRFRADASFADRFLTEARAASRLDHPNVTRVQDFGEEPDGLLYIVMELLQGTDLRRLLGLGSLTQQRRVEILLSVLNALAAADDQGIVHRDIKPENVVVVAAQNEDGEMVDVVKVCDFGLATVKPRQTGGTDIRSAAAAMSWVAGTPEYMSPEQILGETLDIRSDLYACGVILFEMLTGRLPFEAESVLHTLKLQLHEKPPSPRSIDPTIDPRLSALTLKALSKEREKRPANPREFRNELRAAVQASRTATVGGPLPPTSLAEHFPPNRVPAGRGKRPAALREREIPPEEMADRVFVNVASVVAELSSQLSTQQLAARLKAIVAAIPQLLERGAAVQLAALALTLERLANQESPEASDARELSKRALGAFRDESRLGRIAEVLLTGPEQERDAAREVLLLGGPSGLGALVEARCRGAGRELNRAGFINTARTFGTAASRALIRTLAASAQEADGGDPFLLEDLLRALPDDPQLELLKLGQTLAHHGSATVRRTVVARLPEMVGPPARAVLRVACRDPEESVRLAAIASLRRIGSVDVAVVTLARDLLSSDSNASVELRTAAAGALQDVVPELRAEAFELLKEALRPRTRSLMNVLRKTAGGQDDAVVLETIARSLIALAEDEGKREVQRRAAACKGELRERLERLLR